MGCLFRQRQESGPQSSLVTSQAFCFVHPTMLDERFLNLFDYSFLKDLVVLRKKTLNS